MDFTLNNQTVFPSESTVGVYLRSSWPAGHVEEGPPPGEALEEAEVGEDGDLTFSGLDEGEQYVAGAEIEGTWRYSSFMVTAAPEEGGGGGGLTIGNYQLLEEVEFEEDVSSFNFPETAAFVVISVKGKPQMKVKIDGDLIAEINGSLTTENGNLSVLVPLGSELLLEDSTGELENVMVAISELS